MTQDAVVYKCLPGSLAEVVVTRATACGGNCGSCEACMFQSELKTTARNTIGAKPGQRVMIESKSSSIYKAVFLVYVLPLILALAAYFVAYSLGASEGVCITACFSGIILGAVIIVLSQRLNKGKNPITFTIIQIKDIREEL